MQAPHSHRPLSVGRVATQRAHCDLAYSRRRVSAQPQARFGEDDGFDRFSLSPCLPLYLKPGRTTALTTVCVQKGQTCGDHVDGAGAAGGDCGVAPLPCSRHAARSEATPSIFCAPPPLVRMEGGAGGLDGAGADGGRPLSGGRHRAATPAARHECTARSVCT
jgi:hypothetical protein